MFHINHLTKERFAEKWEKSREKYYRLAYCYTKNEQDALEILSEATYKGYCHRHQLRQEEYFDTWMSRIIIFEAYRYLRQKKRWISFEQYEEGMEESGFETAEVSMDIYRCLDGLEAGERTLLILKYLEDRSFREISEILSIPENTVKTRIYRLLKKNREKEAQHGD